MLWIRTAIFRAFAWQRFNRCAVDTGLLSYLEPVLLLAFASIMMGERVSASEWLTYIPIWLAVVLLVIEEILPAPHSAEAQCAYAEPQR